MDVRLIKLLHPKAEDRCSVISNPLNAELRHHGLAVAGISRDHEHLTLFKQINSPIDDEPSFKADARHEFTGNTLQGVFRMLFQTDQ